MVAHSVPVKLPDLSCGKLNPGIIALDLDDTLLRDDLTISDYTVDVLHKAAERGIYITMCTGRADNAILPHVHRLEIAGMNAGRYIIAQNGTSITDLHLRTEIYSRTVDPELLIYAYREAGKMGLQAQVYDRSTIYASSDNEWARVDVKLSGLNLKAEEDFEQLLRRGFPKMVIPGDPELLTGLQVLLKREIGSRCVIFTSKPYFLEVLPYESGKGEALMWLAGHVSVPAERVMAFGDSMNDESMIAKAPLSVAMLNGLPAIKDIARYVTEYTNNEDGVARFVERYVL